MFEELISLIPSLARVDITLLKATRASLINIENLNVNLLLTSTGRQASHQTRTRPDNAFGSENLSDTIATENSDQPTSPTLLLKIPSGASQEEEVEMRVQSTPIPFRSGLYFDFSDHEYFSEDWWKASPHYVDIAHNLRFVPFRDSTCIFPSIESVERNISIRILAKKMLISRNHGSIHFELDISPRISTRALTFLSGQQHWSLRYLPPARILKLSLNDTGLIVTYRKKSFSSFWWLVNHHLARGDEGYLLMYGQKTETQQ